ncbi:ABC transporter permease subunit [Halorubrum sp. CBA1125]|uniref:carbohydrate ABC transporter permease n=1 Tax=Halorubrum sp. CBA1125 TaxID=2668072 RepID=UPI0012E7F745|nr:carbohydrate ABC transporter permease [Halorubrum sp. CBA1125]MUW13385.1 ABC transporter permease subunit [Halorubrum sp. CBA1125]
MSGITDSFQEIKGVFRTFSTFFTTVISVAVLAFVLYPIVILLSASLRTTRDVAQNPIALPDPTNLQFDNYVQAWVEGGFGHYFMNSVIVVMITLAILLVICSLAAYGLVELDIPGSHLLVLSVILGFMVPAQALFIPNFALLNILDLLDTRAGLILTYTGFSIPFTFFLIYQSFNTLPAGFADAARVDGVSELTIFSRVYVPLTLPSIMAAAVVQFVLKWNEFLYALTFITTDEKRTIPAGLMQFNSFFTNEWNLYTAGIVIAVAPAIVIFYFFQNYFIEGITRNRVDVE